MTSVNKYDHYSTEDFIWDSSFRDWVLQPTPYSHEFWETWLRQHPEKEAIVRHATELVQSLTLNREKISQERKEEIIAQTLARLHHTGPDQAEPIYLQTPARRGRYLRFALGAAAVLALVYAGVWMATDKTAGGKNTDAAYTRLVKQSEIALVETINTSSVPLSVLLSDSSRVKLDKGARISYAPSFSNTGTREVYLSGNAFFEVARNARKPFFVHANGVVTKVLGTSFRVKTDLVKKGVTVEVVSGRVEVYEQQAGKAPADARKGNGVILTPNQKVSYSAETSFFQASLVDEPVPIQKANKKIVREDFVFEDAPLSRVIAAMEEIYGIKVEVENEAILNCPFTGDISEQNLYRKFDAICQSTKTSYEIMETKVFIKGQGCY